MNSRNAKIKLFSFANCVVLIIVTVLFIEYYMFDFLNQFYFFHNMVLNIK